MQTQTHSQGNSSKRFTRDDPEGPRILRHKREEIDSRVERQICTGIIVSDKFLERIGPLATKYFQASFTKVVAHWCNGYFGKYHKAPKRSIEDIFEKESKTLPEDEHELIRKFLQGLSEEYVQGLDEHKREDGEFDVDFNVDQARRYFKECIKKTLEHDLRQLKDCSCDEAIDKYQRALAEIGNAAGQGAEQLFTAKEVLTMDIPEPKWAIPSLLPVGLSVLAGKPKKGKSLFALNILLAITCRTPALGNISVAKGGSAIYLALEDTKLRLQKRIARMLKGRDVTDSLYLATEFPKMPEGLTRLENEIQKYRDLRLVVIDTWGRFRPWDKNQRTDPYDVSVSDAGKLKALADRYGIAILLIHHMRKTGSEDIIDTVYGSVGLTATADGVLALVRKGQPEAVLHVSGRDVEPQEIALKLDASTLTWESMGDASLVQSTANRQAIIDAILNNEAPMTAQEIKQATGLKLSYINATVQRMAKQGALVKIERGRYDAPIDERARWKMNRGKVTPIRRRREN
jgi:hypothetical protein